MSAKAKKEDRFWQEYQDKIADKHGLAIVLVEGEGLSNVSESNDNSICKVLSKSKKFAPQCEKFCGKVFTEATNTKKPLKYKCHAGLECVAVPIEIQRDKQFVAITGRAFVKASDYRIATERAVSGDWNKFPPTKFFENVLLTGSGTSIENAGKEIANLSGEAKNALSKIGKISEVVKEIPKTIKAAKPKLKKKKKVEIKSKKEQLPKIAKKEEPKSKRIQDIKVEAIVKTKLVNTAADAVLSQLKLDKKNPLSGLAGIVKKETKKPQKRVKKINRKATLGNQEENAQRKFLNSIRELKYNDACFLVLKFVKERYGILSLAWLENYDNRLKKTHAMGSLKQQKIRISMTTDDKRFLQIFRKESSIELKERNGANQTQKIRLFPIAVSNEVHCALVIGERSEDVNVKRSLSGFCQLIAPELEILRLREELTRRSWLDVALQRFNESLRMIDKDDFWIRLMQHTAGLMQAERGSILVYDENATKLVVKAVIGRKADIIRESKNEIGERIAQNVWKSGKALVVPSISKTSVAPAPPEWKYKTESFISYPISIGERKIGVLNIADKNDGTSFREFDLQLLRSIVPQIAVAIDHATLKNRAGKFEQLSVTDSLTGLLNRRYLEERLTEEIKRSNRHGYPMSFLMVDVDNFKSYNDTFTHPEGDKALQLVAQCIKDSLRGADVASRYGGEEFSILLPQTSLEEGGIIAERIRERISTTEFPNRQVTVSVGIASLGLSETTAENIISAADHALFDAKRNGRNNVQVYKELDRELQLQN